MGAGASAVPKINEASAEEVKKALQELQPEHRAKIAEALKACEASKDTPAAKEEVAEAPAEKPVAEEAPAEKPAEKAPAEKPAEETPAEKPEAPAEKPAEEAPTEKPVEETPLEKPAAEEPADKPAEEAPTDAPAAEAPMDKPAAEAPATTDAPAEAGGAADGPATKEVTKEEPTPAAGGAAAAGGPSGDVKPKKTTGTTKLLIVRHGETHWNAGKKIQGQLDTELNDTGRAQAVKVAKSMARLKMVDKVDAVVSSNLVRASETADLLQAELCPEAKRINYPSLKEVDFGNITGKASDAEENKYIKKSTYETWRSGDLQHSFPEGESGESLITRALQSLLAAAQEGETVIVVAHSVMIRWSAISVTVTLGTGERVDPEHPLPSPEHLKVAMADEEIGRLLKAKNCNCSVSTLYFDHDQGVFKPETWFETLPGDDSVTDHYYYCNYES